MGLYDNIAKEDRILKILNASVKETISSDIKSLEKDRLISLDDDDFTGYCDLKANMKYLEENISKDSKILKELFQVEKPEDYVIFNLAIIEGLNPHMKISEFNGKGFNLARVEFEKDYVGNFKSKQLDPNSDLVKKVEDAFYNSKEGLASIGGKCIVTLNSSHSDKGTSSTSLILIDSKCYELSYNLENTKQFKCKSNGNPKVSSKTSTSLF